MRIKSTGMLCILPFALAAHSQPRPPQTTAEVRRAGRLPVLLKPASYPMPATKLGLDAACWFNEHPKASLYVLNDARDDVMHVWFRG